MTVATGNEVQTVTIVGDPDGGDWTLDYDGEETSALDFAAASADAQTALRALSNLGASDVAVTGDAGGPYTVTFGGALANTDVPLLVADASGLTGGTDPDVEVEVVTGGNPAVTERAYGRLASTDGSVKSAEFLAGQTPPAGTTLVDADSA